MSKDPKKKAVQSILAPAPPQYPLAPQYPPAYPFDRVPDVLPSAYNVHVKVLSDSRATVAEATMLNGSTGASVVTVTGSSRRDNDDEHDAETGTLLAVSRSLEALSRKLARQASARVKSADANRKHRASRTMKKARPARVRDLGAAFIEEREGTEVVAHLLPGLSPQDVPQEVKDALSRLFPDANLKFAEFDATEMMAAFADLLGAEPKGKHSKGESSREDGKPGS
jgi:hypothetical protein